MRLAEAVDRVLLVVVAALAAGVRADLHHAERHDSPGNVLPKFWVPTNGFTSAVGFSGAATATPGSARTSSAAADAVSRAICAVRV